MEHNMTKKALAPHEEYADSIVNTLLNDFNPEQQRDVLILVNQKMEKNYVGNIESRRHDLEQANKRYAQFRGEIDGPIASEPLSGRTH